MIGLSLSYIKIPLAHFMCHIYLLTRSLRSLCSPPQMLLLKAEMLLSRGKTEAGEALKGVKHLFNLQWQQANSFYQHLKLFRNSLRPKHSRGVSKSELKPCPVHVGVAVPQS